MLGNNTKNLFCQKNKWKRFYRSQWIGEDEAPSRYVGNGRREKKEITNL